MYCSGLPGRCQNHTPNLTYNNAGTCSQGCRIPCMCIACAPRCVDAADQDMPRAPPCPPSSLPSSANLRQASVCLSRSLMWPPGCALRCSNSTVAGWLPAAGRTGISPTSRWLCLGACTPAPPLSHGIRRSSPCPRHAKQEQDRVCTDLTSLRPACNPSLAPSQPRLVRAHHTPHAQATQPPLKQGRKRVWLAKKKIRNALVELTVTRRC